MGFWDLVQEVVETVVEVVQEVVETVAPDEKPNHIDPSEPGPSSGVPDPSMHLLPDNRATS